LAGNAFLLETFFFLFVCPRPILRNKQLKKIVPLTLSSIMIPTPDLSHIKKQDFDRVYEPAGNDLEKSRYNQFWISKKKKLTIYK
jgi:hypothetical protein